MLHAPRTIPGRTLRLLVFDLDGTLIDSRADLAASVNATLAHLGRPALPEPVIASYIGDGAPMLVRRALGDPADETFLNSALDFFLDYYREHKLDHTYVYDGVFKALHTLASSLPDAKMAVLTNKPVGPAEAICEALELSPFFFRIYGGNSFATKKPDPLGLKTLVAETGTTPGETLMIGDSDVDILTARNAETWALGCKFGLSPHTLETAPPDLLVDSPSEWVEILKAPATLHGAQYRSAPSLVSPE